LFYHATYIIIIYIIIINIYKILISQYAFLHYIFSLFSLSLSLCSSYLIFDSSNAIRLEKKTLLLKNFNSPFICDFDIGVLLDEEWLADDRFGEAGRDRRTFVESGVLTGSSRMDDEDAAMSIDRVRDNSCGSCCSCHSRRRCRFVGTSAAEHDSAET